MLFKTVVTVHTVLQNFLIMNINRNNYETYFLLYADGELGATDKEAVEKFVTIHPDLGEELDMLLETVLDTEKISMPGKHLLIKPELWEEEHLTPNQRELFLLLDNELTPERTAAIEAGIESDPELHRDWSILQRTQAYAATIEMPDKESLYRHESDRKPIPISWVKWIAAAAVLAGLGWYTISTWSNNQLTKVPVTATISNPSKKAVDPATQPAINTTNTAIKSDIETGAKNETTATRNISQDGKSKTSAVKVIVVKNGQTEENETIEPQPDIDYAFTGNPQRVIETAQDNTVLSNVNPTLNVKEIANPLVSQVAQQNDPLQSVAQQAVYNEDAVDETEYVTIAGARIKKQKLRGVFRNVTRTVSRTFDKSNVAQADVASLSN
jgi:type VI protein secretion system component VasF